jgi:glutathione reductase (NADPH)
VPAYDFDLITIGAGSGGVAASRYAAAQGVRVAICEPDRVGGTCVIRGCIPKKLFMYAAQFAEGFADAPAYGWEAVRPGFDLARLTATKDAETARLEGVYQRLLSGSGVQLFAGRARLLDAHTVVVDGGQRLSAERILLATGGAPAMPPIPGIGLALTSTGMLDLQQLPRRLLVLGGGYIAMEFASIFRALGSEVVLAFRADVPLRGFDADLRKRAAAALRERGVDLQPGFRPQGLERRGDTLVCRSDDGRSVEAGVALNAYGRLPNSAGLGLEALGVKLAAGSGAVCVDEYSRTAVENIYAVGDVTDRLALTPVAIAEGRAFVDTVFGGKPRRIDHTTVASAVFCLPPLACIGLSEAAARERGLGLRVYEADFRPMKNVVSGRGDRSYMKLIVDAASDRVLGVHMLGVDAPEIVQSLAVAVTMGASKQQFDATMALHPTAAEEFMLMRTPRSS